MSTPFVDHPLQPGDRVPNVVFDAISILSLPADLAEQIMASELFASRSHEAEVRRMTAAEAADLWSSAASDI